MITVNIPIVEVTVFVNNARITRRALVHLQPGEQSILVTDLPTTLDPDSIRASGKGNGVKLLGVDMQTRYVTDTLNPEAAALAHELLTLRQEDKVLEDETAQHSDRYQMMKTLHENAGVRFAKGMAVGKATVETFKPVDQYLNEELGTMYARQREIDILRQEMAKKIEAAEKRLAQVQSTNTREWREIQVDVDASEVTDLELEVVYAVQGASWKPIYDARLVEGRVMLTYMAQVQQQSGEDWPAVQLNLSTAHPATSYTIPKLSTWYIDRYTPAPASAGAATVHRMSLREAAPASVNYSMMPAPLAEVEEAEVVNNGTVVTYRVSRPVAIPSDGSPHKNTITNLTLDADLDYVTVPKLAQEVFIRAKIHNTSTVLLLPGKVQVFRGDDFVGNMQLKRVVAPTEIFDAQLGLEDRIKVERELTDRSTTRNIPGVGTQQRITIGYKLKITNNLTDLAQVVVYDQMPVAQNEVIKVRLQDAQPKPTEQTNLNILKWELDIPAQTKRDIPFSFTVEYPRDMTVSGLDNLETSET